MKSKFLFHLTASGLYTSACLASLSLSTDIIILKSKPDWVYFCFLFFSSFFYYNFHKISWFQHSRIFDEQNIKYQWPAKHPGLLFLSLLTGFAGSLSLITICIDSYTKFLFGTMAAILALLYNVKIRGLQFRGKKGFKPFIIAFVTIITTTLIPVSDAIASNKISPTDFILFSLAQLFFIASLCVAADIRDIVEDREDAIKTYPVVAGVNLTKKFILLLISISLVFFYLLFYSEVLSFKQLELLICISLLTLLLCAQLNQQHSYYYFILMIDGLILCQSVGLILIS